MVKRKIPEVLTESEILKLFQITFNPKHKIILMFLYYCGLRVSELTNLKQENINLKESTLKVVSGKGGKDRLIPIPKPLSIEYKNYLKIIGQQERLFKISRRAVYSIVRRQGIKIDKPKIHPHTFRHSYATHILKETNNLKLVQSLLGHESIRTTEIYTHINIETSKANIKNIWG